MLKALKVSLEFDNIFYMNAMDDAIWGTAYGLGGPFKMRGSVSFAEDSFLFQNREKIRDKLYGRL